MEEDGFTLVSKRKSGKLKRLTSKQKNELNSNNLHTIEDFGSCVKKVRKLINILKSEDKIGTFINEVKSSVNSQPNEAKFSQIICYGLGKVSQCRIACAQLAFLLVLKDKLSISCDAFDPSFTTLDLEVLQAFNINVINLNEKGKRKISLNDRVLFYMPHCELALYNNLLWANWNKTNLPNLVIIGNSFKNAIQDKVRSFMNAKYRYIVMVERVCSELAFPSIKSMWDVFNNLSLISINQSLPNELWVYQTEPVYSDDELL